MKLDELKHRFFKLAAFNILSNLMVPLASLVDTAFLGHLAEIRHLAGVALAAVLFKYLYWTFGFLRMATTGLTAQAMGRRDKETVWLILLRNSILACLIGCMILLLRVPVREIGFWILRAAPEIETSGQDYYNALVWGAPATLINFALLGWFLGRENGRQVLLLSMVSNLSNIALNYWFIVQLGWASAGAGAATALSQYLMLVTGLIFIVWEQPGKMLRTVAPQIWNWSELKASIILNSNILIRTFAIISVFSLFINFSANLGTEVLAINALLMEVIGLSAYFLDGLAFATESLAGNFQGESDSSQLRQLLRLSGGLSLGLGLSLPLIFITVPRIFFQLLTSHSEIIDGIEQYVLWLLPVIGFGSIAFMLDGYFLGLTAGKVLRQSAVLSAIVACIPMLINLRFFQSIHLLWFALALFMLFRGLTLGRQVAPTLSR